MCVCVHVRMCACAVWHSGELTMNVSDLITDLTQCSPLIFDGPGQWKGHRVVLQDLTETTQWFV